MAEFVVVLGINTWGAVKHGYWPWPATIVRSCLGIIILDFVSLASPEFAVILGAGLLLGLLLGNLQAAHGSKVGAVFGAVPPQNVKWDVLTIPGMTQPNRIGNDQ